MIAAQRAPGAPGAPKPARGFKQPSALSRVKKLIVAAKEEDLPKDARSILVHASVYMDTDGWAFPSPTLLADDAGYSEKAVRQATRKLIDAGILVSLPPAAWKLAIRATRGTNTPKGGKLPMMLFWQVASTRARAATLAAMATKPNAYENPQAPKGPFTITIEGKDHGPYDAEELERFARTDKGAGEWSVRNEQHTAPLARWFWFGAHLPLAPGWVRL